jgi:hypothetical protein
MTSINYLPVVFHACQVFQHLIEVHLPADLVRSITYLDYGLHCIPRNLNAYIQEHIDSIGMPSLVVLRYGLCGNGLDGIQAGSTLWSSARGMTVLPFVWDPTQPANRNFRPRPAPII